MLIEKTHSIGWSEVLPNLERTFENISERKLLGSLLMLFRKPIRISTREWAETYRVMTGSESAITGKFKCSLTPWMYFVMECLDNPNIPTVVGMKSAQIAWTETMNNHRGKRIHTDPCNMILAFARDKSITKFYKQKWKPFYTNTPVLRNLINVNVPKEGREFFEFPGGHLSLITLGAIGDQKSVSAPYQEIEEPDDAGTDVSGQGDSLSNLQERQKTFPRNRRKIIFGGTPTIKDFSRVEAAYLQSNQMVYKAECHACGGLHELSFSNLFYEEYPHKYIDSIYGKDDPNTAYYKCPLCDEIWTFEQKNINVTNGLKHGNLGWHITKPSVTDIYGFRFNELLSPFDASRFEELAKAKIKAEIELAKGNEGPMKSFVNNKMGMTYSSSITAVEAEEMITWRKNYQEGIVPIEGLVLTCGIDVQDNRFAIIVRAHGKNNNSYLVKWIEIFGKVTLQEFNEDNTKLVGVWGELEDFVIQEWKHAGGKTLKLSAISIDSGDNTELVYKFAIYMAAKHTDIPVICTKGSSDLKPTNDPIFSMPKAPDLNTAQQVRDTLAESMGVSVFPLGAHRAHTEILTRINRNKEPDARSNIYFHNKQDYGQYEEQMTSCTKIISGEFGEFKERYRLKPGKRKEAMDAEKNALHASYYLGIPVWTYDQWRAREKYLTGA